MDTRRSFRSGSSRVDGGTASVPIRHADFMVGAKAQGNMQHACKGALWWADMVSVGKLDLAITRAWQSGASDGGLDQRAIRERSYCGGICCCSSSCSSCC
jgi:hypothetical protein